MYDEHFHPANLFDGVDFGSSYQSCVGQPSAWVALDFGQQIGIKGIRIFCGSDARCFPRYCKLEVNIKSKANVKSLSVAMKEDMALGYRAQNLLWKIEDIRNLRFHEFEK